MGYYLLLKLGIKERQTVNNFTSTFLYVNLHKILRGEESLNHFQGRQNWGFKS